MPRPSTTPRPLLGGVAALALLLVVTCCGADGDAAANPALDRVVEFGRRLVGKVVAWYWATPPAERIPVGGLVACGFLGIMTLLERSIRLRHRRVLPSDFVKRLKDRMEDVKLDRGKILDLCELNPSPASRVALAAVKRWGRSTVDLERAVTMANRVEADRLRRNVGTLRRVAALAPLLGLLGTLLASGRVLNNVENASWAPAIASALGPFTIGVAIAILSLAAYDGLIGRLEKLTGALERLGAETVDAIALAVPPEPVRPASPHSHAHEPSHRRPTPAPRGPHQVRVDIPNAIARAMESDDDLYDL